MYTLKSLEENQENFKNFLIDICNCFTLKDVNYTCYECTSQRMDNGCLYDKLVAKVHTEKEAYWIIVMFEAIACPIPLTQSSYIFPILKNIGYGDEEFIDPQACITELSFKHLYTVNEFKGKVYETETILVLSMDDILYFLGNCYPNPIYHIMPDIRQLNEKINEQEQQIQGLLNTIANLKHNWN